MYLIVAPLLWLASLAGAPAPQAGYHPYTDPARPMAVSGNNKGAAGRQIQAGVSPPPEYRWWVAPRQIDR